MTASNGVLIDEIEVFVYLYCNYRNEILIQKKFRIPEIFSGKNLNKEVNEWFD